MSVLAWNALAWGLCGLALVGVLGHTISHRGQALIVVATGAGYLMALSLPALIVSLVAAASPADDTPSIVKAAAIAVSVVLVGVGVVLHAPLYGRRSAPAAGGRVLTVLTSNLLLGRANPAALIELLKAEGVEVFFAQELTDRERDALGAAGLDELFPHSFTEPADRGSGTGIWSRYPLAEPVSHPGFGFRVLSARLLLEGTPGPMVWSVHLQPPWPRRPAGWLVELPLLRELLDAVPHQPGAADAVVVGGDFNATWNHRQFRQLRGDDYEDASVLARRGALLSWPADRPWPALIGLDHVLVRSAGVQALRTVKVDGSDHRAVLSAIVLVP